MPRKRDERRDKAFEIYKAAVGEIKLTEIAKQLDVPNGTIRSWKNKDKWEDKILERSKEKVGRSKKNTQEKIIPSDLIEKNTSKKNNNKKKKSETNTHKNKSKARYGNKNAVGNSGGNGAKKKNKYALTTGEYEHLFYGGKLTEEEKQILLAPTDLYSELIFELKLLSIREKRIFERLNMYNEQVTKVEIDMVSKTIKEISTEENIRKETETETITKNIYYRILACEDALTRVQARKAKTIELIHKFDMDNERIEMERERLILYKEKLLGIVDFDQILEDELDEI